MTSGFFQAVKERVPAKVVSAVKLSVVDVERVLKQEVSSEIAAVRGSGDQTLIGGGKRLRPLLAIISARATGNRFDKVKLVHVGAALEMIHMATLIHDDVIDGADTRRGHPTASAIYGNTAAILSGDVLLAKAMNLLARYGDIGIIEMVSRAVVEMAEGEVRELECRGEFELSEEEHMRVLQMKTAAFIECCCRVGCRMAGGTKEQEDGLGVYGHHLGLAFQVVDDLLDFQGNEAKTGKPIATDFREGQATLPLIYLLPSLNEQEAEFARRRFGNGISDDDVKVISDWMKERGAFDAATKRAESLAARANRGLAPLPDSDDKLLLETVTRFVVERDS